MNTWNVAADDLEFLSRHLEDLEAAGTPSFGLILTEQIPCTFDSKKKTLWGEDIGTLEDIISWLEEAPKTPQVMFCEKVTAKNVLAFARGEVFTVNAPERIELIPARQVLEELTKHFAQQTDQNQGD